MNINEQCRVCGGMMLGSTICYRKECSKRPYQIKDIVTFKGKAHIIRAIYDANRVFLYDIDSYVNVDALRFLRNERTGENCKPPLGMRKRSDIEPFGDKHCNACGEIMLRAPICNHPNCDTRPFVVGDVVSIKGDESNYYKITSITDSGHMMLGDLEGSFKHHKLRLRQPKETEPMNNTENRGKELAAYKTQAHIIAKIKEAVHHTRPVVDIKTMGGEPRAKLELLIAELINSQEAINTGKLKQCKLELNTVETKLGKLLALELAPQINRKCEKALADADADGSAVAGESWIVIRDHVTFDSEITSLSNQYISLKGHVEYLEGK